MKWKTNAIAALAAVLSLSLTPWAGAAEHTPEIVWLPEGVSISKEPYQNPSLFLPSLQENGRIQIRDAEGKVGFASASGEIVIEPAYDQAGAFFEGLAWVSQKQGDQMLYGAVNEAGDVVIPLTYAFLGDFHEERALVGVRTKDSNGLRFGYLDPDGTVVIPLEYQAGGDFSEGVTWVTQIDGAGLERSLFLDTTGERVIPRDYAYAGSFVDGLAVAGEYRDGDDRIFGLIERRGEPVVPIRYPSVSDVRDGMVLFHKWAKDPGQMEQWLPQYGYYRDDGTLAIPAAYRSARDFSDGLAFVAQMDEETERLKFGVIDQDGNEVIPLRYDGAERFSEGLAWVMEGDPMEDAHWGCIDPTGQTVIPFAYAMPTDAEQGALYHGFVQGVSPAAKQTEDGAFVFGFLNRKGEEIIPFQYQDAGLLPGGMWGYVQDGARWGIFANPCYTEQKTEETDTRVVPLVPALAVGAVCLSAVIFLAYRKYKSQA